MNGNQENSATRIRAACPGIVAPMATGDGLLLRIRHPIGGLSPAQALTIAAVARRHGSGALELTSRGNLQLRGVTPEHLPAIQHALLESNLADSNALQEALRNVLAAPIADIDPTAVDVHDRARQLAQALVSQPSLQGLPPKIGVLVDGGGSAPLDSAAADLRLEGVAEAGGILYRMAIGTTAQQATVLGWVHENQVVDAAIEVLERFLNLREHLDPAPRRLADAIDLVGSSALVPALAKNRPDLADPIATRSTTGAAICPGWAPNGRWLGVAFPFGALVAEHLERLAEAVAPNEGSLRLTPWRMVLLVGATSDAEHGLHKCGAILDASDRRLNLGACIGQAGCSWATTPTRPDALTLTMAIGSLLDSGVNVHVNGCTKACGRSPTVPVALTAESGRYSLALREGKHWHSIDHGLTLTQAQQRLAALDAIIQEQIGQEESVSEFMTRFGVKTLAKKLILKINNE